MYYEINVSKDGKHLFATDRRCIEFPWNLAKIYPLFKEKFPESEGYKITVTYWETKGKEIKNVEELIQEINNFRRI